jgi:hypothetical protein
MDSLRDTIRSLLNRIEAIQSELDTMTYSQSDPGAMMERAAMRREINDARTRIKTLLRQIKDAR